MGQRQPSLSGNLSDKASQTALRAFRRSPLRVCVWASPELQGLSRCTTLKHTYTLTLLGCGGFITDRSSPLCPVRRRSPVPARPSPCSAPSGVPHRYTSLIGSCLHPEGAAGFLLCVILMSHLPRVNQRSREQRFVVNNLIGCLGEQSVSEQ